MDAPRESEGAAGEKPIQHTHLAKQMLVQDGDCWFCLAPMLGKDQTHTHPSGRPVTKQAVVAAIALVDIDQQQQQ